MSNKIVAVIPARGGSKGIPKKNLRILNNKPLIQYQIETALECKDISEIVVTSEDEDILEFCSKFPIHLRKRPKELSKDHVTLDPVIYDAITYLENKSNMRFDVVITLQPTSPLLKSETLSKAIRRFFDVNADTLIPVIDSTHLFWKEEGNAIIPDYTKRVNRQWLPKRYKETGAFLISKRKFVKENSRFGKKIEIYALNEAEGIDIDTPFDWLVAETLLRRLKIVFVVNGNRSIGMGHIYRALTLADRFLGNEIIFVSYKNNKEANLLIRNSGYSLKIIKKKHLIPTIKQIRPNIVINDILDTNPRYIEQLKNLDLFVVNFEDLGKGSNKAHLVFNALYERTNPKENHRFGYEYVCLNERFYLYEPIHFNKNAKTLFVSFGGVDENNLTCKVLSISQELFLETSINKLIVVIGPSYIHNKELKELLSNLMEFKNNIEIFKNVKNMPKLMREADIAITSNGRTVYELTVMGIPTLSISQNDRETLHLFARYHPGIKYLGIACKVNEKKILEEIKKIVNNSKIRRSMHQEQLKMGKIIKYGVNKITNEIFSAYWRWNLEKNQNWYKNN
ncbi:MAG: hypothetical protein PWP03_690 [Candidatus Woesearchaeota archaeon]|nr:hypothetical protein [Candidatus Woesearchaeota archaeon]